MDNKKLTKIKDLPQWALVEVVWLDAYFELDPNYADMERHIANGGVEAKSLGYLWHVDQKSISIYSEYFPVENDGRAWTIIPLPMVQSIREVTDVL